MCYSAQLQRLLLEYLLRPCMCLQVQPHAERFAEACKLDAAYITNFGEHSHA